MQRRAVKALVLSLAVAVPAVVLAQGGKQTVVVVKPLGTNTANGTLNLKAVPGGVEISGELKGLPKNATLGFHVHEKGDCSAPDGSSAGGHFNPTKHDHGAPAATDSHVGDLGNLTTDANGNAKISVVKKGAALGQSPDSYVGKAVIVHSQADDLKSQPSGNAGGRIGCGVITAQ